MGFVTRHRRIVTAVVTVVIAVIVGLQVVDGPTNTSSPVSVSAKSASILRAIPTVTASSLPREARNVQALIASGGPFPFKQDGIVFENRELLLPRQAKGYYHEYTVKTPGDSSRGARRIVTGAGTEQYYTADHYRSFRRIVPG